MDVLRSILLKPLTLKQKIEGKTFRASYCKPLTQNCGDAQHPRCRVDGTTKILTTKSTATSGNLYHIEDNLLTHAFCVKLFLVLLYRLQTNGVPCLNFLMWNEIAVAQFPVELRR